MKFFLDNNLSRRFVEILGAMLPNVEIIHLASRFTPSTPDTTWMPEIAQEDWIVLSCDEKIRRSPDERAMLASNRLMIMFMPSKFLDLGIDGQVGWITEHIGKIESCGKSMKPGDRVRLSKNGTYTRLPNLTPRIRSNP